MLTDFDRRSKLRCCCILLVAFFSGYLLAYEFSGNKFVSAVLDQAWSTKRLQSADDPGHFERPLPQYPGVCAQESRVALYKKVCDKYNVHNETKDVYWSSLVYDKKLFGCLLAKAGSTTWYQYLVNIYDPTNTRDRGERNDTYLRSIGLDRVRNISVVDVRNQYHDWHKYIVVRHPLQRIVSAYLDTAIRRKYCPNPDGTLQTFLQFVQKLLAGECPHPHYQMYTLRCKMCDVDYQFVVKQETLEHDKETFKELYGLATNINLPWRNLNEDTSDTTDTRFKYDKMLGEFQQEHPDLMRRLVDMVSYDMELFGYSWDWQQRKSYCVDDTASGCC